MKHFGDFQTRCNCSLQSIKESQVCNSVRNMLMKNEKVMNRGRDEETLLSRLRDDDF